MSKINFFSLGGMDENEKSCYVLEVDNSYYIFNLGITIPVFSKLGIKKIIPYVDWIEENSKLIKGIFIGTASFRNIGAFQYIYDKIKNIPIFTSKIGAIVLKSYLNKRSMQKYQIFTDLNIKILKPLKTVLIGNVFFTPFRVVTRMPDSYGFVIGTKDGNIIYIDEFMINSDRNNAFINDLTKINYITKGKNLLLINNVGNVAKNGGFTSPNHKSKFFYNDILNRCKNRRILISCFDTDIHTFLVLAQLAKEKQIPFIIYNPIFMNVFNSISNEGIFNNKNLLMLPIHKINEIKNGIVLISSTPVNLFNKLISISKDEDDILKLKNTDKVVLGFKISSGFEKIEAEILDRFAKLNIDIQTIPKTILKMEASCEDHKFLVNELSPKYIIPTLGMYSEVIKYSNCLKEIGYDPKNIITLYNGEIFSMINGNSVKQTKKVDVHEVYVGSQGILNEGVNILQERHVMSENGIVFYLIEFNESKKQFDDRYVSLRQYGVISEEKENLNWINELANEALTFANSNVSSEKKVDFKELKQNIKKFIAKQIEKTFSKTPIVVVSIS